MTDEPQNSMEQFRITNPAALRCGPHTWAIQLADGQQLVVQAERVDVSTGVLCVHAQIGGPSYEPVALFPPGSWTTAYKIEEPGSPADILTHLVVQQPVVDNHTHEEHSVDDE